MGTDQQHKKEKQSGSGSLMWGVTAIVAVAIVGVCVFIAMKNRQVVSEPAPVTTYQEEPVYQPPAPIIEEEPEPVIEEPVQIAEPEDIIPAPIPEPEPVPVPQKTEDTGPAKLQLDNLAGTLKLHVNFLDIRDKMPRESTCFMSNASPAMDWSDAPPETKSYVVFLEKRTGNADPDFPFVNWILFDIPEGVTKLQNSLPRDAVLANGAKHATSDHDNIGYLGPCEPKGKIDYALRVFALDTVLAKPAAISKDDLIRAMNGHIIDAAEQEFHHYHKL